MNAADDFRNQPDNILEFPRKRNRRLSTQPQAEKQHVVCLAVLPSKPKKGFDYEAILLPALRTVLELDPYYWQVASANEKLYSEPGLKNVIGWTEKEHPYAYILDKSDQRSQIDRVVGYLVAVRKERPIYVIALEQKGGKRVSDPDIDLYIEYTPKIGEHAIQDIANELKFMLDRRVQVQEMKGQRYAHYLSPIYMQKEAVNKELAEFLSSTYKTMEAFAIANYVTIILVIWQRKPQLDARKVLKNS